MTTQELGWQQAISAVLRDAEGPLKYDSITQVIGERGLRTLTGATPAATVNSYLSQMIRPDHPWYDKNIRKVGRGIYVYTTEDSPAPPEVPEADFDDDDTAVNTDQVVRVAAFGLYWDKDKVKWNSNQILGRTPGSSSSINFADQQGVYILHKDRSVVYVGRTSNSLYARLRAHNQEQHRTFRWNSFSWFGFRDIDDETGALKPMPEGLGTVHLINILESVLIEALEPPVNGRRGDFLGLHCEQVPDPEIAQSLAHSFLKGIIG